MKQGKGLLPIVISCVIVAAVFLVVALVAPFVRTDTYWVAFAFAWAAILIALGANLFVVATSRSMKSALYRASISSVSIIYLIAATVVSLVFMACSFLPNWILIVVQVVLLALCLLSLVGGAGAATLVERDEAATAAQASFIGELRMKANGLVPFATDEPTREALSALRDKLRFTDPVSSPATAAVDQQLSSCLVQIESALRVGDNAQIQALCSQTMLYVEQREAICRSTK